jgi:hypothetical protein
MDPREICCEDGSCRNGLRWCAVKDFDSSGTEPSTSATSQLYLWQEHEDVRLGLSTLAPGKFNTLKHLFHSLEGASLAVI